MKIALDISPIKGGDRSFSHKVRGMGFYIENIKNSLIKYDSKNQYVFIARGEKLPKDIDLVHYPYFEPFFLTLSLNKKIKNIVTVHDLIPLIFPNFFPCGIKGKIKWKIQKFNLKKADAVITDSETSKKDIVNKTGIDESKIHVIYLSAGEEFKRIEKTKNKFEILKKKYNLPENYVLYVGDATWNKNLPTLINAIKKANLSLVMVGKVFTQENIDKNNVWNNDLISVKNLIKGDGRFVLTGFVSLEDLIEIYNFANVFVLPSKYEGFGLPILEAMACGCPVVTTKEGSIPEIAQEAAFYTDAYDLDSMASGINKVFLDKNLQNKLIEKGLIQSKKFSWEKTAKETVRVYNL